MLLQLNATADWINLAVMGLMLLAVGAIAWGAQWQEKFPKVHWAIVGLIGLASGISAGLWGLISWAATLQPAQFPPMFLAVKDAMGVMALWGILCLVPYFRSILIPLGLRGFNPKNSVHLWSLYLFGICVIYTTLSIFWLYQPQIFLESFHGISMPLTVVITALLFTGFSVLASGPGVQGSIQVIWSQLGLKKISFKTMGQLTLVAIALTASLEAFERTLLPHLISPEMAATLKTIMAAFKLEGPTWWIMCQALILAIGAGVGEEVLFRGLIQPVFGIIPTALLFALIHIHYGPTILLGELFVVGCILGIVRRQVNTTGAIWVHLCFDFFALTSGLYLPQTS